MLNELKNQLKAWGQYTYHTVYLDGEKYNGIRDCEKRLKKMYFNPRCKILDMGCNMGGMIWPLRLYYGMAVGIERDVNCINFCENLSKFYNVPYPKTDFIPFDLKDINEFKFDRAKFFDVIFFLALTQHLENWKDCLKWIHEHGDLLFIEFNGQPDQITEYMNYMKTLRTGFDYIGEFNGRFLYTVYTPINWKINGVIYQTYLINRATNCDVYYCHEKDIVIKAFKNEAYENEVGWCAILDCAPNMIDADYENNILVQEFCGQFLTYWNAPDDYVSQVENIKKELIEKKCRAEDAELHVKDGKIKIVDLGACTSIRPNEGAFKFSELDKRIDWEMGFIKFRREQYLSGLPVTVHNNKGK